MIIGFHDIPLQYIHWRCRICMYMVCLCILENMTVIVMVNFNYLFGVYLFIYLGFYVAFNTVQVISRWVVGRAEETST